jgi:BED zinc finger
MIKQENEKAKCKICSKLLSRRNGGTTGLRKHLHQVHQIQSFKAKNKTLRSNLCQISPEQKKKLDSLVVKSIVQDGRGFDDMRRPGIAKMINYLLPGKKAFQRNPCGIKM